MNPKSMAACVVLMGVFVGPGAPAHHSFAAYDSSKEMVLKGTVNKFEWTNPHSWIYMTVTNDKGDPEEWRIECGAPNVIVRMGWKQKMLRPGDAVTVAFSPMRDGAHGGSLHYVILPDGTRMGGNAAPPDAAPSAPVEQQ